MRYFLAHNETDIFHYGEIIEEQVVTTGQPHLEFFEQLDQLKQRLLDLGTHYQEQQQEQSFPEELPEPIGDPA